MKAITLAKRQMKKEARESEYWAARSHEVVHKDSKSKALRLVFRHADMMHRYADLCASHIISEVV
jgi:excinuclease UvrABC nuclease subunit